MIISRTQYMLFNMFILARMISMPHPRCNREHASEPVVQHMVRYGDGRAAAVELEYLVALVPLVGDERPGPLGAEARAREEVHCIRARPAELALRLDGVGVPVAALAYVPSRQVHASPQGTDRAGYVTEFQRGGRE